MITVHGIAHTGLTARIIPIEIESRSLPTLGPAAFDIAGVPEPAAREIRVRVRAALDSVGHTVSDRSFSIKVGHGDLTGAAGPGTFGGLDLPIALGCLAAMGVVSTAHDVVAFGELSLLGAIRPVRGAYQALAAIREAGRVAIVPAGNVAEAWDEDHCPEYLPAGSLADLLADLRREAPFRAPGGLPERRHGAAADMADLPADHEGRRPLEIAAAAGVGVLLVGPPGAGKTMLARRMPGILPPMGLDEVREATRIYSAAGILSDGMGAVRARPFRAPHHTVSEAGLLGGGNPPRPGEVTLAHNGVLMLDEVPEFRRGTLQSLAVALREKQQRIARNIGPATPFPSDPMLVGAMNPCPCGYGYPLRECACTPERIRAYQGRISSILSHMPVRLRLTPRKLSDWSRNPGEDSASIQARVVAAKGRALARKLRGEGPLERTEWKIPLRDDLGLQAWSKACNGLIAIARAIADLDGSAVVQKRHGEEACALHFDAVDTFDRPQSSASV